MGTKAQTTKTTTPAINMAKDLKKGMFLRAKKNVSRGYGVAQIKKGDVVRFYTYRYDGRFRTSIYGHDLTLYDFEVITELEAAQDVVDKLKAKLATAEAKVDALKNPPWVKGDKFTSFSGTEYVIHHIDTKVVTYQAVVSGSYYAKDLKAFQTLATRR